MTRRWFLLSVVILVLGVSGVAALDRPTSPPSQLESMTWLSGSWEGPMAACQMSRIARQHGVR